MEQTKNSGCFFCTGTAAAGQPYEPCQACKEKFGDSVPVVCVTHDKPANGNPAITSQDGRNLYPTGQYMTVKPQGIKDGLGIDVQPGGIVTLMKPDYDKIVEAYNSQQ